MYPTPEKCPICGQVLVVKQLSCAKCNTEVTGKFEHKSCRYCALEPKMADFLEVFLRHRGILNSVGDELGISYPTVRSRLDQLLVALKLSPMPKAERQARKNSQKTIIDQLSSGKIDVSTATKKLRGRKK